VRIGIGYDVHRLVPDRPLVLGGVLVPSPLGLEGHSDADVLTHAVIDALLGAAALGDIGRHFPDTDPQWRGADSLALLRAVVAKVAHEGLAVANVDATVVLQRPRLRPHVDAMRANLAAALGVEPGRVSVKATTGEGMGFVGRAEGAAAHAVTLLVPRGEQPGG
jgi:2-C-methyl-D-erythritol 2,4-cyclodiphosphate synthase